MTSELTRSNVMVGTVNYMAPEQLRGDKSDHRVDIFSFGVVLYELFGGSKPFQAESFASIMYKILEETPEPLEQPGSRRCRRSSIAVVDRAIAKAREDRYQLMAELHRDLESAYELDPRWIRQHLVARSTSSLRGSSQVKPQSNPPHLASPRSDAPTIVCDGAGPDAADARAADAERGRARCRPLCRSRRLPGETGGHRPWPRPRLPSCFSPRSSCVRTRRGPSRRRISQLPRPLPSQAPAATPVERPTPAPAPPPETAPAASDPQLAGIAA